MDQPVSALSNEEITTTLSLERRHHPRELNFTSKINLFGQFRDE
jgi:hypothetical protein